MTDRELMQQALYVLETVGLANWEKRKEQAIKDLRARLAQPEPELSPTVWCGCGDGIVPDDGAICGTCAMINRGAEPDLSEVKRIATQLGWKPPVDAEPESVAYKITSKLGDHFGFKGTPDLRKGDFVYTAPPQREWVGLTDEEIRNEANHHVFDESFFNGAIWARGQIMGKNNG